MVRKLIAGVLGVLVACAVPVVLAAQGSGVQAQIQAAIRALLGSNATITGNWTCSGTCTGFGGGGGITLTAGQVGYGGMTANTINGSPNFTWAADATVSTQNSLYINENDVNQSPLALTATGFSQASGHGPSNAFGYFTLYDAAGGLGIFGNAVDAGDNAIILQPNQDNIQSPGGIPAVLIDAQHGMVALSLGEILFGVVNDYGGTLHDILSVAADGVPSEGGGGWGMVGVNVNIPSATLHVRNPVLSGLTTEVTALFEGSAAQTADLIDAKLTGGSNLFRVDNAGQTIGTDFLTSAITSVTGTSMNSCGTTSPALGTGATNSAGTFTVGATSGTDCTLTFSVAAPNFWTCGVSDTSTAVLVRSVPATTTTTKVQGVFTAADVIQYACNAF